MKSMTYVVESSEVTRNLDSPNGVQYELSILSMAFPKRSEALGNLKGGSRNRPSALAYGYQRCRLDRSSKDFQECSGTIGFNNGLAERMVGKMLPDKSPVAASNGKPRDLLNRLGLVDSGADPFSVQGRRDR
jgi:hypothetical protein